MLQFLAFNVPKEYHVNPFEKDFLINPLTKELNPKQQRVCLVASILIGIFSLGIYHLTILIKKNLNNQKQVRFKAVVIKGHKKHIMKSVKKWKNTPAAGKVPDFSYVKPHVDFSIDNASEEIKLRVEERCLEKMREAIKVMDTSIVDAANEIMTDSKNPEFLETVNKFSNRILDVYEAYVEILEDQHIPDLPMNVSALKASGFTHKNLLDLIAPCKWYHSITQNFYQACVEKGLEEKDIDILLNYIAKQNYIWDQDKISRDNPTFSSLYEVLDNYDNNEINHLCDDFISKLKSNNAFFIKIKEIDFRLDFIQTINQSEKEAYKSLLAETKPVSSMPKNSQNTYEKSRFPIDKNKKQDETVESLSNDPEVEYEYTQLKSLSNLMQEMINSEEQTEINQEFIEINSESDLSNQRQDKDLRTERFKSILSSSRLLREIQSRFELREFETGAVGSSLRLLNIIKGKYDKDRADQYYRTKLFFCYGSKGIINEVCQDPEMIKRINAKLEGKNKGWKIDEKLATHLAQTWKQPIYRLGIYANENNIGPRTRHYLSAQEVKDNKIKDPNLTYAEAERIAKKENVTQQDLRKRFRIQLSEAEELSSFGTTQSIEKRELERRKQILKRMDNLDTNQKDDLRIIENSDSSELCHDLDPLDPSLQAKKISDSNFLETPLEYKKKIEPIRWQPGKHFFQMHNRELCKSPYLEIIEGLGLPQYAGISGSSDQTFTMAGIVGMSNQEDLINLRFTYLPWMSGHEDHTVDEIMTAVKSFGLDYQPSADYYKQILPGREDFTVALKKAQQARGYEMPDYYLSKDYAIQIYDEEWQKQVDLEANKNQLVMQLLANHQLLMQTQSIYRSDYKASDVFGDKRWQKNMQPLTATSISKKNKQRYANRSKKVAKSLKYALNFKTGLFEAHHSLPIPYYQGTSKTSVSLIPSSGKVIPYVEGKNPHLNRVGLLYDSNECEYKEDKFVFRKDVNTLGQKYWRKFYSKDQIEKPNFQQQLVLDSKKAMEQANNNNDKISIDGLIHEIEKARDQFVPYNEILASVKGSSIKGVFVFSKGLPLNHDGQVPYKDEKEISDWPPLHGESQTVFQKDEDYDCYMLLLGIGKKIMTRQELGIDVPLYEINVNNDKGLSLVSINQQRQLILDILNDDNKLNGIARIVLHQGNLKMDQKKLKNKIRAQLNLYLKEL